MSQHHVELQWQRESADFTYRSYNRDHRWVFDGGAEVPASASPGFLGNPACVDPEEALIAALSSCHLLTFLAIAAKRRFVVDAYSDRPVGYLERDADGRFALTRVSLRPRIVFGGEQAPSPEQLRQMHEMSHRQCFIANSVKTRVTVESE